MAERVRFGWFFLVVLVFTVSALGCGDEANAPHALPAVANGQFHPVRFASSSNPARFTSGPGGGRPAEMASPATEGASTFWAHTDRDAGISVNRVLPDGSVQPYVTLTVPRGSLLRRPDGTAFHLVDSIAITVTPEGSELRVTLEPTGLVFNPLIPAQLTISYQSADPDFNGDGLVNSVDEYISQVLLGLEMRQAVTDPWQVIPSINDVISKTLSADLRHFTGYAVSW